MGDDTSIAWCDATFNPWWGCTKVSDGCKNCYAESMAKRTGFDIWGADKPRRFFNEKHWQEPRRWDRKARERGGRTSVFISMCDPLEGDHDGINLPLAQARGRLWALIEDTPNLNWLILTKRPQNRDLFPARWQFPNRFPSNVRVGVTAENQQMLDERMPWLAELRCPTFVSMEPMLGPISIRRWNTTIDWVIVGGESGASARIFDIRWARYTAVECRRYDIPFFMKQLGRLPVDGGTIFSVRDRAGANPEEWPEDLRIRQFPRAA